MRILPALVTLWLLAGPLHAGPLHDAVRDGDAEEVARLIAAGADPGEVDFLKGSPLHIAALKGHAGLIDQLTAAGADPDAREFGSDATPLHWATLGGRTAAAERLIAAGADIDARNEHGETPLHIAFINGHIDTGRALIDAGGDYLAKSGLLITPLEYAAMAGAWDLVDQLAAEGAIPDDPPPIAPLLASADITRGPALWDEFCEGCHGRPDRASRVEKQEKAPPMKNIIGRDVASVDDYPYSEALLREDGVWTYEKLNRLMTDAGAYWPGTRMVNHWRGREVRIEDPEDRAAVIMYLRSFADPVPPLP